jgi:hypothetical protein
LRVLSLECNGLHKNPHQGYAIYGIQTVFSVPP